MYSYTNMYINMKTYMHIHIHVSYICLNMYIYIYIHVYIYIYNLHICTYIYMYICVYTHIYICMCSFPTSSYPHLGPAEMAEALHGPRRSFPSRSQSAKSTAEMACRGSPSKVAVAKINWGSFKRGYIGLL